MVEMLNGIGGPRRVLVLVLPLARLLAWAAAFCAVVAAGLGGYWMSAGTEGVRRLWAPPAVESHPTDQSVIDMPEVIANLRKDTPSRYLKIGLSLAVAPGERARVEKAMPQLNDALQEFLRNLDQDDLEGSAGLHRLRTEIRRRFNLIASEPNSNRDAVADVLLRSLLTQ
ncbi:flagellar FliL protein [Azospirillum agricola]|uniref:flagellar basal body-associated FliL family protein n=1 Tax=Azospirillum agricola TaxID=1720247 RepID=UPI001AE1426A|nr:flagellar basal body-associated FliL family protein [Azospirillum agricola]MBP2232406.1 flagellar FliL protein [Azospirillum agricola]